MAENSEIDTRTVFVVHGRNDAARNALFAFLRALDLKPLEWGAIVSMTGEGSPYIGQILDRAFKVGQAVVVLLTPDDIAYLRTEYAHGDADPDLQPQAQARPNVLFEAGMAFGLNPKRTILIEMGTMRPFSDVAGRHVIRLDNTSAKRSALAKRLLDAGCPADTSGTDWLSAGDLTPPPPPGVGLPLGRRLPPTPIGGVRVSASYMRGAKGSGTLRIANIGGMDLHNLNIELPEEAGQSIHFGTSLPIAKLPAGKTISLPTIRFMSDGAEHFDIAITGTTPDGNPVRIEEFISLTG